MKKDFIIDYFGYIVIRALGPLIRCLPESMALFLGRRLGEILYCFGLKHKALAYSNIKTALSGRLPPSELSNITKNFYRNFGQSLAELFFIPLIDKEYMNKYVAIDGLNYVTEGFRRGKGVIFLGMHAGSWELSNIICVNLGFPFSLFIREQRYPRLNQFINSYRNQKGGKIIQRQNQTRQLIKALENNEAIGMTADQGAKGGVLVKFFGKDASMPTGAIRLALKYDAALIPAFYIRIGGPYIKVIFEPPFKIRKTGDKSTDIRQNLQEVVNIFEKYILKYPQEYLWSYKIWKYTTEKHILILSDGKTGHLRQSQALAKIVSNCLGEKRMSVYTDTLGVEFKNNFTKLALAFSSCLAGKYHCQGCLLCLRAFLKEDSYKSLVAVKPDIIISCGSSLAPVNFILAQENLARSMVIMRPSVLSARRFDLAVMSRHDQPPRRKNVVAIEGALNLIDEDYLKEQTESLLQVSGIRYQVSGHYLGLLIGGDTKSFHLREDAILKVIKQIKFIAEKLNMDILVTTSRRTSKEAEKLVKEEFKDYPRCKLLIIANEKNIPEAVGGVLALSQIIIASPESISMISEAVKSRKYVLVFDAIGLPRKHHRFLNYFAKNKYIYLVKPEDLSRKIEEIWQNKPPINTLKDNLLVSEAIKKVL